MTVRAFLIAAVLVLSQAAFAQIETVVHAVETSPANLILPGGTDGMMTFRPCQGECERDYIRVRLSADTRYTVDGRSAKYTDFRRELTAAKGNALSLALVTYETGTKTVTSIKLAR